MSNYAYITTLKNLRKHPNADRLQLGECFGNTVCVNLDYAEGEIGVYISEGAQLSEKFCEENNLCRKKDSEGNNIGGYLDPNKRNVKTIALRGEKSDGLFLPLSALAYTGANFDEVNIGDCVDTLNGHVIATKYVPRRQHREGIYTPKKKKFSVPIAPLFEEHVDTQQLAYNLDKFAPGDLIEITLKLHGTSGRTAHLPTLKGFKKSFLDHIFKREGKPVYDWGYVSGTRRTVLDPRKEGDGYYNDNTFRIDCEKEFADKLFKNVTAYYEIVGYTNDGTLIMGEAKVPKDYQKQYGNKMVFSYDCAPAEHDIYVYRMTMTNEDKDVIEIPPDVMRFYCERMNIKTPPLFLRAFIPDQETLDQLGFKTAGNWVYQMAERYASGPDPIDGTHVREGVVVRKVNSPKFEAYKLKNYLFKLISGIIVEKTAESATNLSEDILEEM